MKIYNKNIKLNCFTHWNILILLLCIYNNNFIHNYYINNNFIHNYIYNNYINLYNITACWSWSIFITFHSGIIYDNNAFFKIRKKINCNFIEFHSGNFILHTLPCLYIYYYPPINIRYYDSYVALFIKGLWVYVSTNKTMDLSGIYVAFSNKTVKQLYITSIISCLSVPFFYKI